MDVGEFYTRYPSPLRPRPIEWARPLRALAPEEPARILHAGCATGSQTVSLAHVFPRAEVVGVDVSEASLAIARARLPRAMGGRLLFERADLTEPLDRFGLFDMAVSYGVLHHIPRVDAATAGIRAALRTERSPFVVFVYGRHGRARIARLQEALARWQEALPGLSDADREAAMRAAARAGGTFAGPRGWAKRALVGLSRYWRDVWIASNADTYLNPYVRYYDIEEIFDLLDRNGLSFGGFVRRRETRAVGYPWDEGAVLAKFRISGWERLPERARMAIVDRLAAPREYEFVCFKAPPRS